MATNTLLTPDMITKEALRILHEKLAFIGTIDRQYDGSFAQSGAKIGSALRIRKPVQYNVTTGATFTAQDTVETNTTLTVDTQKHVGMSFSSEELTMDLDDFSKRVIEPAMAALASNIEVDVLETASGNTAVAATGGGGATATFKDFLTAQAYLDNLTTPRDNSRTVLIDTLMQVDIVDALKGLFQDSAEIAKQYREGIIGKTAGASWYQSARIPLTESLANSTQFNVTAYGTNTLSVSGATASEVINKGTQFEMDGVFAVHPESKKTLTQKYWVTAQDDLTLDGGGLGTLNVAASVVSAANDPKQNISGNSTSMTVQAQGFAKSLVYHKDAFTFATADLRVPKGVDMAARETYDGISLRLISDYSITDDTFGTRIDVLYGFKCIRPEFAAVVYKTA